MTVQNILTDSLETFDHEIFQIIKAEEERQRTSINLIASENVVSVSVQQAKCSILSNKYSEGYPSKRYYGGVENIDNLENLCMKRALEAFNLDENEWGVNVQVLSGTPANFAVYTALCGPNGKIMGLELAHGGHLSHGFKTKTAKVSATSLFFESSSYKLSINDSIDYEELKDNVKSFHPNILICGASSFPRDFDYKKFKEIADEVGAYLMCDMAHICGFIATGLMNNPFEYCDVVTTTTHKTFRGPRGALIFYKKKLENKINRAVFPGLHGGPHNDTIAGIAVSLKQMMSTEYKEYTKRMLEYSRLMAEMFIDKGYNLVTGGSDNHIILIDLTNKNISGLKVQKF